ncbi:Nuclear factor NF-kappa-B p105 subunit [Clydaea vesicula]|uniref:Nuclear factor NF-kappa-B p105 subunit n=1 Tax=Clydaea vesicula TaxID=447962 RepID=A0AAD5U7N4_9FUNG|nr:Nuclear factor NF-kappa-B p105 subunit [Clydaea vesicula]
MNLCTFSFSNDVKHVEELLGSGLNVNETYTWAIPDASVDRSERSYNALPLNLAVIQGHVAMVNLLLNNGAKVEVRDGKGRTPLICALYGSQDTMKIGPENYTTITNSSLQHIEIVRSLLSATRSEVFSDVVDSPQNGEKLRGITPLCLAAYLGKLPLVKLILDFGADVNGLDKNARDGHIEVVKVLLDFGARHDIKDVNGWLAVQYAQTYPQVVQILQSEKCKSSLVSQLFNKDLSNELLRKFPKFHRALGSCINSYAVDLKLEHEVPLIGKVLNSTNLKLDNLKQTRISIFVFIKNYDFLGLLKLLNTTSEFDLNYTDISSGLTPLQYAARIRPLKKESEKIIKLLVSKNINLNIQNSRSGKTALHYLIKDPELLAENAKGEQKVIADMIASSLNCLLLANANPNIPDFDGNSPLHLACKSGHKDLIQSLLKYGGKINVVNLNGDSPYSYCSNQNSRDILKKYMQSKDGNNVAGSIKNDSAFNSTECIPQQRMMMGSVDRDLQLYQLNSLPIFNIIDEIFLQFDTPSVDETEMFFPEENLGSLSSAKQYDEILEEKMKLNLELISQYQKEIDLMDHLEENAAALDTSLMIIDRLTVKYDVNTKKWEKKGFELDRKIKVLHLALESNEKSYKSLEEVLSNLQFELQCSEKLNSLKESRIRELESLLSSKNEILRNLTKKFDEMSMCKDLDEDSISQQYFTPRESMEISSHEKNYELNMAVLRSSESELRESLHETKNVRKNLSTWRQSIQAGKFLNSSSKIKSNSLMLEKLLEKENGLLKEEERLSHEKSNIMMRMEDLCKENQDYLNNEDISEETLSVEELLEKLYRNSSLTNTSLNSEKGIKANFTRKSRVAYDATQNELDPVMLNRLLIASKSRINHLKTTLSFLRSSNDSLQEQLDETNKHLEDAYSLLRTEAKKNTVIFDVSKSNPQLGDVCQEKNQSLLTNEKVNSSKSADLDQINHIMDLLVGLSEGVEGKVLAKLDLILFALGENSEWNQNNCYEVTKNFKKNSGAVLEKNYDFTEYIKHIKVVLEICSKKLNAVQLLIQSVEKKYDIPDSNENIKKTIDGSIIVRDVITVENGNASVECNVTTNENNFLNIAPSDTPVSCSSDRIIEKFNTFGFKSSKRVDELEGEVEVLVQDDIPTLLNELQETRQQISELEAELRSRRLSNVEDSNLNNALMKKRKHYKTLVRSLTENLKAHNFASPPRKSTSFSETKCISLVETDTFEKRFAITPLENFEGRIAETNQKQMEKMNPESVNSGNLLLPLELKNLEITERPCRHGNDEEECKENNDVGAALIAKLKKVGTSLKYKKYNV